MFEFLPGWSGWEIVRHCLRRDIYEIANNQESDRQTSGYQVVGLMPAPLNLQGDFTLNTSGRTIWQVMETTCRLLLPSIDCSVPIPLK